MTLEGASSFVFDFDGTLAPNLDLPGMRHQVIELTLARGVPRTVFADHYILEIVDAAHGWLVDRQHPEADAYREETEAFITGFELEAASRLEAFPEVRRLLNTLRRQRRRTAVVTRNCEQAVRATFPDIDAHLDVLLARDAVPHCKPDPRHLQRALDALGAAPETSVMVGDGRMDMQLGKAQGLTCIGVLTGSSNREALVNAGADVVLDHVAELESML